MSVPVWLDILSVILCLPALMGRVWGLSPTRLGVLPYAAALLDDLFVRRRRWPRQTAELGFLLMGSAWLGLSSTLGWVDGIIPPTLVAGLEIACRLRENKLLQTPYSYSDRRWSAVPSPDGDPKRPGAFPHPSRHPELTINLEGPFVSRHPTYDLGDIPVGRTLRMCLRVGNHSFVPGSVPLDIRVESDQSLEVDDPPNRNLPPLPSGEVAGVDLAFRAARNGPAGRIRIGIRQANKNHRIEVWYRSVFTAEPIREAVVSRYPGARRAAFAWRGDMDHYDTVTFQSIEGLENTLGLAARYRFPQTMYLSTRLSLDQREAQLFYDHYGVDRGADQVPAFIDWIREKVDLRHTAPYPFTSDKPYLMEVGNHMHLHYGTDAAACPENGWKRQARMGAGPYPWMGSERDSFSEQRDNALEARRRMESSWGFTPRSWAMPDSTRDEHTPTAVEAAGCEVLSDSDAPHTHNILRQPPPHHPKGTSAVELTKRYPGDPEDLRHLSMVLYWVHRAHRKGFPVIYMGHQHLRRFSGLACTRLTEYLLRYVLSRFNGDLYIDTVYGVGRWWLRVLSPSTRTMECRAEGGEVLLVNSGTEKLESVPVDVVTVGGRRFTVLLDVSPGEKRTVDSTGEIRN